MKAAKLSINKWMDEKKMWYIHTMGYLFSNKNKWAEKRQEDMDGP